MEFIFHALDDDGNGLLTAEVTCHKRMHPSPCSLKFPKDPAVLKMLRDSKCTMCSKVAIAQSFAIAIPLRGHVPWSYRRLSSQRRVHSIVNTGAEGGGVVKTLTLRCSNSLSRSPFSTAGSFVLRSGRSTPGRCSSGKPAQRVSFQAMSFGRTSGSKTSVRPSKS